MALIGPVRQPLRCLGRRRTRRVLFIPVVIACAVMAACQAASPTRSATDLATDLAVARAEGTGSIEFGGLIRTVAFFKQGRALVVGGCQVNNSPSSYWNWDSLMLSFYETRSPRSAGKDKLCLHGLVQVKELYGNALGSTYILPQTVTALAASPDGTHWVAGDAEGRLIMSTTVKRVSSRTPHQKSEITAIAFSPDGKRVASGAQDTSFPLGFLDVASGGMVKVKMKFDPISALAFSPDGKDLAVGTINGGVAIWDVPFNTIPEQIAAGEGRNQEIMGLAFSSDGRLLAYGRRDGQVLILDVRTRQPLVTYKAGSAITALAFSPDSRYLAMGEDNGKVRLLETESAREAWLKRFVLPVADLAYSPDGTSLAIAVSKNVYLFQLDARQSEPTPLQRMDLSPASGVAHPAKSMQGGNFQSTERVLSSQKLAEVLRISQDEYMWLLPFDKLTFRAVSAMATLVPGASVEHQDLGDIERAVVKVGERSLALDLRRLQRAKGKEGLSQVVRAVESSERFFLASSPGMARKLEDAAISAILSELGPGLKMVSTKELGGSAGPRLSSSSMAGEEGALQSVLGGGVKYLKLVQFDQDSARRVRQWLASGRGAQVTAQSYVLDLRGNAGGSLEILMEAASHLLPKGRLITRLVLRKNGDSIKYQSRGSVVPRRHLVVLVNEQTAGTAELLACAIQASRVGVLVGGRTAGVDEVYTTFWLPGGDGLRVSTGRFLCPDELSIRWKGLSVDVEVGQTAAVSAVPIGASRQDPLRNSHMPSPLPVSFQERDDQQLRTAVSVALCLSHVNADSRGGQKAASRNADPVSMLSGCH